MLKLKGTKDVPEFKIAKSELTCSGGIPGTWTLIRINSSANGFTNKTPYSGKVHYSDNSGQEGDMSFEPNEFVFISGHNIKVSYIVMYGGGEEVLGLYS